MHSTGNYIQHLVITYKGKQSEKVYLYVFKHGFYNWIYIYITEPLCYTPETNTKLQIKYMSLRKNPTSAESKMQSGQGSPMRWLSPCWWGTRPTRPLLMAPAHHPSPEKALLSLEGGPAYTEGCTHWGLDQSASKGGRTVTEGKIGLFCYLKEDGERSG